MLNLKTAEGSTGRLMQLSLGYFFFYVITGITVKYFTGAASKGFPAMQDMEFLVYSTTGGSLICLAWVFLKGWYRIKSNGLVTRWGIQFPGEFYYIIPSGIFTAVVIVTTTLNYMLLPSVMVAMVITRASVIVISRAVDAIQISQGILKKRVYLEEDLSVVVALLAVATQIFMHGGAPGAEVKPFLEFNLAGIHWWMGWQGGSGTGGGWTIAALMVLAFYILSYMFRIYIMNFYKNTRGKGVPLDNCGFFGVEQIAASVTIVLAAVAFFLLPEILGREPETVRIFRGAILHPNAKWLGAILAGTAYGLVAFFSVFIFMFKGRTATFAGLVNRLTSLMAGTASTVLLFYIFSMRFPRPEDWVSFGFILVAVGFLTRAERRRAAELVAAHEIPEQSATGAKA
ncbi:MAG: hypothetical protein AAB229_05200 [Candidatus Hydrogenedentota bacterium]